MKLSELRQLVGNLVVVGNILYTFGLCIIASGSGHYIQTTLKGLIGFLIGWGILIVLVWKLPPRKRGKKAQ